MSPRPARLRYRISELCRLAGVSKATVQHYVAEGLLPRPRKTGRTMAYYDPACVERIRLIKELQARYLPLSAIKRLLGRVDAVEDRDHGVLAAAGAKLGAVLAELEPPLPRDELTAATGIAPEVLPGLERIGLVAARVEGGREVFGQHDVAILRAVAQLTRAGIGRRTGFEPGDLLMYRDALSALISREIDLFAKHAFEQPADEVAKMATAAALGATELVAAIHRKLVAEFLAAALPPRRSGRTS